MSGTTVKPQNLDPQITEPAKKRRRKASTNGAGEDCASCRKRGSICDRKRPYCGACCEQGKECPGYKTVLTWGVGVASRGKLRGMSLPIPVPVTRSTNGSSATAIPTESKSKTSAAKKSTRNRSISVKSEIGFHNTTIYDPPTGFKHENSWQLPPPPLPPTQIKPVTTQPSAPAPAHSTKQSSFPGFLPHVLEPIQDETKPVVSTHSNGNNSAMPTSPRSLNAESEYGSYRSGQFQRTMSGSTAPAEDFFTTNPFSSSYPIGTFETSSTRDDPMRETATQMQADMMLDPRLSNAAYTVPAGDTYATNISQPIIDPVYYPAEQQAYEEVSPTDSGSNLDSNYGTNDSEDTDLLDLPRTGDGYSQSYLDQVRSPQMCLPLFNISPRIRGLLDYYDKVICPVVVAFDGGASQNPYRTYILNLAMQDTGLQHAIAALSLNNMRMKETAVLPRFLAATSTEVDNEIEDAVVVSPPTAEETGHKAFSVKLLNQRLTSAMSARDDSVLATLLVLCLFHVSDSGFSKFKVQLTGVRKLLLLRGQMMHTEFISWVEIFFAWFDAMTSAVNDREVEISGECIDLNTFTGNLAAPEQYSGCDSRLFKLISRLGRLNLLAQEKPVSPDMQRLYPQNFMSMNDFTIGSYPSDFGSMSLNGGSAQTPDQDHRAAFWQEWRDIRHGLAQSEIEHMHSPYMISMDVLSVPQRDMLNISECFRLAALLYTERLAHPELPSGHDNFQGIIAQALFHIAQISENSCMTKFMLWPLFIVGTECIAVTHRQLVQKQIISIYNESGFYNNLSGLRVLLKVWRENRDGTEVPIIEGSQPFAWRKAMDRLDGEYIII